MEYRCSNLVIAWRDSGKPRKTCQESWYPGRDSTQALPGYEPKSLPPSQLVRQSIHLKQTNPYLRGGGAMARIDISTSLHQAALLIRSLPTNYLEIRDIWRKFTERTMCASFCHAIFVRNIFSLRHEYLTNSARVKRWILEHGKRQH